MKKSLSWRLFVLVAGTLFGLLAGLGLAAPAVAAPVQVATTGNYHDRGGDLTLKANGDGRHVSLKVVGDNYDSKKVDVKVVQVSHHGRHRVVDHRTVWTDRGDDFKYEVKYVECGKSYQAHSYSKKDGWNSSERIWIKCDRHGHYSYK
ncbi:hypothetical protein [Arthrobacter sp. SX1312]|uniref:hypothetical protein n=1 Tax=Arthrobacter sp. SX1312 TaxID=2058896 RepID=UPI0011B02F46|nr:hypothetical protein [Arthrobacter sp. SX1312]